MIQSVGPDWARFIPYGCIVATARLYDVIQFGADETGDSYGDFSEGKYGWLLDNVRAFEKPIPARGRQRIWNWENDV
ncbi:MAG: hypothetical protein F4X82_03025 [Candidatus Spechtbacteria bacterium SB0662_bin_43]|uniref:Uncharacterized protein n=1 Tax=Candidatus Spechtbacteria bacterium SB0662_bin_43 TaxID=2604897 RepID=A0A845DCS4_9BACT|nr:hypothetical protein [Candidatus Spechtbacteria bacterium SB0662_bin_43]